MSFRPRPAEEESTPSPEAPLDQPEERGGDDKSQTEKGAKLEENKDVRTAHQSGDEETEEEENPLVRTQPGSVFDKRIGKERKRIAMDDFTEEKYSRRAEEKEKKWKTE